MWVSDVLKLRFMLTGYSIVLLSAALFIHAQHVQSGEFCGTREVHWCSETL